MIDIMAATDADLVALATIEREAFPTSAAPTAWKPELDRAWAHVDLARTNGEVVGYCNYWLVAEELHLHAIATLPSYRGRGIATALLGHTLATAVGQGCKVAMLEVRASNTTAIRLYERAGFATVHVRAAYYRDNDEDAWVMSRAL